MKKNKQLFTHNPIQDAMQSAYEDMLKEEDKTGGWGDTANFFEDILVEDTRASILPENAVIRNVDGTISIMMETITAEQWEVLKQLVQV